MSQACQSQFDPSNLPAFAVQLLQRLKKEPMFLPRNAKNPAHYLIFVFAGRHFYPPRAKDMFRGPRAPTEEIDR